MADTIEERACELAVYMIENGATVRAAAKHFGISKSTVHTDVTNRKGCRTYPFFIIKSAQKHLTFIAGKRGKTFCRTKRMPREG